MKQHINIKNLFIFVLVSFLAGFGATVWAATSDLEKAYLKEYAFLVSQESELKKRMEGQGARSSAEIAAIEKEIKRLEQTHFDLEEDMSKVGELLLDSERQLDSSNSDRDVLLTTYEQSRLTMSDYGNDFSQQVSKDIPHEIRLTNTYQSGISILEKQGDIIKQSGEYFLESGKKISGQIIKLGGIAAFGVSDEASGILLPAGEGELKLWGGQDAEEMAVALSNGEAVDVLKMFLFESLKKEVNTTGESGLIETINNGGVIAWIIIGLGVLALIMVLLRAFFLRHASAANEAIIGKVASHVREGNVTQALSLCANQKGSSARVVTDTLRNIDRDRDHIEDIVSESILHESNKLNKYGVAIIVIAAVSPLLGLLGTVTGMIATFNIITEFGTGDPKLLSGGISVALITTQLGLIVAIPALIFGNLLSGWCNRIKDDMEKSALHMINLYGARDKNIPLDVVREAYV